MDLEIIEPHLSREEATKNRIMDACCVSAEKYGIANVRIKHIVENSQISRQTVYNHFRNIDEIVNLSSLREGARLVEACSKEINNYTDIEDRFVKAFLFVYQELPLSPILRELVDSNRDFFSYVNSETYSIQQFGLLCFQSIFDERPELLKDVKEISEYCSRGVLSLLLLPSEDLMSIDDVEKYVRLRFLPGLCLNSYGLV